MVQDWHQRLRHDGQELVAMWWNKFWTAGVAAVFGSARHNLGSLAIIVYMRLAGLFSLKSCEVYRFCRNTNNAASHYLVSILERPTNPVTNNIYIHTAVSLLV
jgi:hypothetical protein